MLARLKVDDSKRFLITDEGDPFFWMGDTAWELFHKLNKEEAELYLRTRAKQGFNVVQAVALAEFNGLEDANAYGRNPLQKNAKGHYDPTMPDTGGDYSYWDHVDEIIKLAGTLGIYIAFLPTWGDKYNLKWGIGPEIFTPENAFVYASWLAKRYLAYTNIIWVLGGDRPLENETHEAIIHQMARALPQPRTFHPPGGFSSSDFVHDADWLDFNMIQTGHSSNLTDNGIAVRKDYARLPIKPSFDSEPCYEDHPIGFKASNGYFDAASVRRAAYYNVFSGGLGHTYGHHSVWSMTTKPTDYFIMTWKDALNRPGALQMQHLKRLIESFPFLEHHPAPELTLDVPELESDLDPHPAGVNHALAIRGERHALIYFPNGIGQMLYLDRFHQGLIKLSWFNPRTGEILDNKLNMIGERKEIWPPTSGRGEDYVLIVEV